MSFRICNLISCPNNKGISDKNVLVFRLPRDVNIREQWINLIKKVQQIDPSDINNNFGLCELHFAESQIRRQYSRRKIVDDAIPIIPTR